MKVISYFSKLFSYIIKIISTLIYLVSFLIPKNDKVWVFGSWMGGSFSDNTKYLYLYVANNQKEIIPVWLTKDKEVISEIRNMNMKVHHFYSFKGVYYSLVARVAVMSTSWIDLPITTFIFNRGTKYVQLWHGTPLKYMNLKAGNFIKKFLRFVLISYLGREYDIVVSDTDLNLEIYQNVFNVEKWAILSLGQPRNDVLFIDKDVSFSEKKFKKVILYLPTWRSYDCNLFNDYGFSAVNFNDFLKKNDTLLVLKVHPNDVKKYSSINGYENIIFISTKDIYPYLNKVDILMTDYSSIYFDFLLLDRPIIYTCFDYDKYHKKNGFYYNYNDVTPGPKANNWDDVILQLNLLICCDVDDFKNQRKKILELFNRHRDGGSSKRVYESINSRNYFSV